MARCTLNVWLSGIILISLCEAGQSISRGQVPQSSNPTVALYRRWALQYERDAQEAEQAAKYYAQKTKDAVGPAVNNVPPIATTNVYNTKADVWTRATLKVQQMLNDPRPAKAAAAAAKAAEPYNKAYAEYDASKAAYSSAAVGYGLRAQMDSKLAKQLQTYSSQYRLQGNKDMADTYDAQSRTLMTQAENYKKKAEEYDETAQKIYRALPQIQAMAGKAGAYAAYEENPTNMFTPEHVFPFTVAPPLALVQIDASDSASTPRTSLEDAAHDLRR